jgi:large subunit ribosomal protein L7/L12
MTVLELSELVKALEEEFGVSASAPVAVLPLLRLKRKKKKQSSMLYLSDVGDKKLQVVKAVRELTGLPLKEAKDIGGQCSRYIEGSCIQRRSQMVKTKIEEVGGKVEIK